MHVSVVKMLKGKVNHLFIKVFVDFEQRWRAVLEEAEDGGVQSLADLRVKFQRIHSVGYLTKPMILLQIVYFTLSSSPTGR